MTAKVKLALMAVFAAAVLLTGCVKDGKCGCVDEPAEPNAPAKTESVS
ncbi:hypothetical protein [Paenibacillus flagellatus]|nr:hypothetical protein [Paenibacillus flagellatus]